MFFIQVDPPSHTVHKFHRTRPRMRILKKIQIRSKKVFWHPQMRTLRRPRKTPLFPCSGSSFIPCKREIYLFFRTNFPEGSLWARLWDILWSSRGRQAVKSSAGIRWAKLGALLSEVWDAKFCTHLSILAASTASSISEHCVWNSQRSWLWSDNSL